MIDERYEGRTYPGSSAPVRNYAQEKYGPPPEIEFGKPAAIEFGISYWPISELAILLNRSTVTLRRWEANGDLPQTRRSISASKHGAIRLYTAEELEGLLRIAHEEGLIANPRKKLSTTNFRDRAARFFEGLNA